MFSSRTTTESSEKMSQKSKAQPLAGSWGCEAFPDFSGKKVFILDGAMYGASVKMFVEAGFKKAETVAEADLVCFLGGADVTPSLYNQNPITETNYTDKNRDTHEKAIFEQCRKLNIPMYGICRGAQFLHVMCGGSLWQHVDNHAGSPHLIYDIDEDVVLRASSLHHQMMAYNDDMDLLAVPQEDVANIFKSEFKLVNRKLKIGVEDDGKHTIEVEACFYDSEKCLCIQGHPEVGPREFTSWSLFKLHDLLNQWKPVKNPLAVEAAKRTD